MPTVNSGGGTVFKLDLSTSTPTLTTLHSFNNKDGSHPTQLIQAKDNNLYSTTTAGGPSIGSCRSTGDGCGTVFKLDLSTLTPTLTTLYSFTGEDGADPIKLIRGEDGNFYGTTLNGGPNDFPNHFSGVRVGRQ
jgi:hypothetical protein